MKTRERRDNKKEREVLQENPKGPQDLKAPDETIYVDTVLFLPTRVCLVGVSMSPLQADMASQCTPPPNGPASKKQRAKGRAQRRWGAVGSPSLGVGDASSPLAGTTCFFNPLNPAPTAQGDRVGNLHI